MPAEDDEAERVARAKRLREEIDELTRTKSDSPHRKLTPREFTDKAASEAAREAGQRRQEQEKG
jgi:hypothetical protein